MEMKFNLEMRQKQALVMTPKLQQALKLLQMPAIELQQMLKQEIIENPLLEEVDDVEEIREEDAEEEPRNESDKEDKDSDEMSEDEKIDWDEYFSSSWEAGVGLGEDNQEEFFEKVPVAKRSFTDQLISQLRIVTDDEQTIEIGDYLIGSLDESGYLTCDLEEVANTFGISTDVVAKVLQIIQTFEPPGVGARSLQESLLIQLENRKLGDSLAATIIRDHFDDFKHKKYLEISKKIKISI
ncbi:MAG: hypothetical protein ABIA59_01935, partial [Candidatus Latescibacterota bacterium]